MLLSKQESSGFPSIKWFGKDDQFYYMVMELLGQPVSSLKRESVQNNKDLSLPIEIICKIGMQIIDRLNKLHETGLIHRDIKPENLLFGLGRKMHVVHLIDFGFCKSYLLDDRTHIRCETGKSIIGTPNFISINMHNRLSLSRRDDLESMVYVLIYLFLPLETWKEIFKEDLNDISLVKAKTELLANPDIHNSLKELLQYCINLDYEEAPNYEDMKQILTI